MTREEEIKKLVEEMTPNVLLYVETLMEHYEKLENENQELKLQLLEKKCCDKDIEYKEKIKLQQIIDKAIEYIENHTCWELSSSKVLQILKGDSNE